jgi:carbon-monoxide dehydrogenase medium subunit
MPIKEYFRPTSLEESIELLAASSGSVKILAGGTDLLMQIWEHASPETRLVSLRDIEALRKINQNGEGEVFVGAMVKHAEVAGDPLLNRYFPALAEASGLVGSPSTRNMGTIGGNICNASPSADTAPPLLAYDAKVVIRSFSGETQAAIEDFFTGPSTTRLKKGQIVKGFILKPRSGLIAAYEKLGIRKAMEIAIVNACVSILIDQSRFCSEIRIALGAVAPMPIRAKGAERVLKGRKITHDLIRKAAEAAMDEATPISDIRASAGYRMKMIGVLLRKMISDLTGIRGT